MCLRQRLNELNINFKHINIFDPPIKFNIEGIYRTSINVF